jgi:hypothetical protein
MIVPANQERHHYADHNYFIHEKDEDLYKHKSIRNSCLDLISSLIEVFGDQAVESILINVDALLNPVEASKDQSATKQGTMDEVDIFEQNYISRNRKHMWKRREVAQLLIGSFAEDISMFRLRNPQLDLKNKVHELISAKDLDKCPLRTYLQGRSLWMAIQLVEILPKDYEELHISILHSATQTLISSRLISLKLVATRALIKYSRKLQPEVL